MIKSRRIPKDANWFSLLESFIAGYKDEKKKVKAEKGEGREVQIEGIDALEGLKLHSLIQELAIEFCAETLAVHPVAKNPRPNFNFTASETEKHRIQRALYRFEIFRAWFADMDAKISYRPAGFGEVEMSHLFLSTMRPWEVEELACIRDWIVRVYRQMLRETRGLITEMDLEVERDELRCFMRDEEAIEERARRQILKRGKPIILFAPSFFLLFFSSVG